MAENAEVSSSQRGWQGIKCLGTLEYGGRECRGELCWKKIAGLIEHYGFSNEREQQKLYK